MTPGSGTGLHMDLLLTGCPRVLVSLYVTECTSDCMCVSVLCACTNQILSRYKLGYSFVLWCWTQRKGFYLSQSNRFITIVPRLLRTLITTIPSTSVFTSRYYCCASRKSQIWLYKSPILCPISDTYSSGEGSHE